MRRGSRRRRCRLRAAPSVTSPATRVRQPASDPRRARPPCIGSPRRLHRPRRPPRTPPGWAADARRRWRRPCSSGRSPSRLSYTRHNPQCSTCCSLPGARSHGCSRVPALSLQTHHRARACQPACRSQGSRRRKRIRPTRWPWRTETWSSSPAKSGRSPLSGPHPASWQSTESPQRSCQPTVQSEQLHALGEASGRSWHRRRSLLRSPSCP
mmetsp:Transcript_56883/g.144242  ORF Transcript_56883/g.144242 Transcript_56883/m.144242 type:complete len:211 (-) Transcript_56883:420-1052(-)